LLTLKFAGKIEMFLFVMRAFFGHLRENNKEKNRTNLQFFNLCSKTATQRRKNALKKRKIGKLENRTLEQN